MLRIIFFVSLLILSVWGAPSLETMKEESRVALVVGNSDYDEHPLTLAVQNARKMKTFLEKNNFYVYYGENLDKKNFIRLLRKFNKRLRPNGIGFVYFCGHAVQTRGKNYILPVESGIFDESMIARQSISLHSVYSGMENSYNRLNIVLLDTAFEAPFGTLFTPDKKGLAAVKSPKAQVIFLPNDPGSYNGSDTFTRDFLNLASGKGVELSALKEKLAALRKKEGEKTPYIKIARNQPFYFVLPDRIPPADELAYEKIKNSSAQKEFETFINTYPNSAFTPNAKKQLSRLIEKEQVRLEFEAQAKEATRKAKEAALKEAEEKALAEKAAAEKEAAEKAAKEKNEIMFKLTKPEDVVEDAPVKPKEGEERQILLE